MANLSPPYTHHKRFIHLTTTQNTVQKCNILLCILLMYLWSSPPPPPPPPPALSPRFLCNIARHKPCPHYKHNFSSTIIMIPPPPRRRYASPLTCSVHSALHSRCVGAGTTCTVFSVNARIQTSELIANTPARSYK